MDEIELSAIYTQSLKTDTEQLYVESNFESYECRFIRETNQKIQRKMIEYGDFFMTANSVNQQIENAVGSNSRDPENLRKNVESLFPEELPAGYMVSIKNTAEVNNYSPSVLGAYRSFRDACAEVAEQDVYYDKK